MNKLKQIGGQMQHGRGLIVGRPLEARGICNKIKNTQIASKKLTDLS
ncbi:MAG: hypothetical protein K0R82_2072 [Flavipsychrobacter sp.]|jgi:hypothetical protein|nr:hypothetical protein [Flavipsychrobacter sp.]